MSGRDDLCASEDWLTLFLASSTMSRMRDALEEDLHANRERRRRKGELKYLTWRDMNLTSHLQTATQLTLTASLMQPKIAFNVPPRSSAPCRPG